MKFKKPRALTALVFTSALLSAGSAFALPVLTRNAPGAETITIYPDHLDANLYYIAPTVVTVSKNEHGVPNLSYMEYGSGWRKGAVLQFTLRADFTHHAIGVAKETILRANPAARFAGLPLSSAEIDFSDLGKGLIASSDCRHPAGTLGDEQSCVFELTPRGITVLRPALKRGLTITMQFRYSVAGVADTATGLVDRTGTFQVAGRVGGPELAKFPELFSDRHGRIIKNAFLTSEELLAMGNDMGNASIETGFDSGNAFANGGDMNNALVNAGVDMGNAFIDLSPVLVRF